MKEWKLWQLCRCFKGCDFNTMKVVEMTGKQTKTNAKSASSGANRQDKVQVAQVVGEVGEQISDNLTPLQPQN